MKKKTNNKINKVVEDDRVQVVSTLWVPRPSSFDGLEYVTGESHVGKQQAPCSNVDRLVPPLMYRSQGFSGR